MIPNLFTIGVSIMQYELLITFIEIVFEKKYTKSLPLPPGINPPPPP